MVKIRPHPKFDEIHITGQGETLKLYTVNLDVGKTVYDEKVIFDKNIEFREWNPNRSKLAAAIMRNVRHIHINRNSRILYLGASSGTTVSHISDIAKEGIVFSVEFAPRSIRELVQNCENRKNVISIMGDANFPEQYAKFIYGEIDLIYMDVAQPNQSEIAIKNCKKFLKDGGILIITIKARSINTSLKPNDIFKNEIEIFEKEGFEISEKLDIAPYTRDHLVLIARYFE